MIKSLHAEDIERVNTVFRVAQDVLGVDAVYDGQAVTVPKDSYPWAAQFCWRVPGGDIWYVLVEFYGSSDFRVEVSSGGPFGHRWDLVDVHLRFGRNSPPATQLGLFMSRLHDAFQPTETE